MTQKEINLQRKAKRDHAVFMKRSLSAFHGINRRVPHSIEIGTIRSIIKEYLGKPCRYCGEAITVDNFSLDHSLPLARGGSTSLDNIRVICVKDNHAKGSLTHFEFFVLMDLLKTFDRTGQNDILSRLRLGGAAKARFGKK